MSRFNLLLLSRKIGKSSKAGEQRGNSSRGKEDDVTALILTQFVWSFLICFSNSVSRIYIT